MGKAKVREMNRWEEWLLGVSIPELLSVLPGLLLAGAIAWVSIWLSDVAGTRVMGLEKTPISAVMVAVLLGIAINNTLPLPSRFRPGLSFAVNKVLRLGIILLGFRLSIFDVFGLSALGVPVVAFCVVAALVLTTLLNRWLHLPARLGTLIAVGTSICGVSAIVAMAPAIDADEEEVSYAVAVITVFGIAATLIYPHLAHLLFAGDATRAGLFLGTSVHDTSQVAGAAMVFAELFSEPRALEVATVTKLVRNLLMAVVIPLMTLYHARGKDCSGEVNRRRICTTGLLPLFIVGFLLMAALRSLGDAGLARGGRALGLLEPGAWQGADTLISSWAVNVLVLALAAVGLKTNNRVLKGLGIKPFLVGLGAALTVGVISFAAITVLARLGAF
jgi:uncharacterized integral membrane protein (TIGR00698 family)